MSIIGGHRVSLSSVTCSKKWGFQLALEVEGQLGDRALNLWFCHCPQVGGSVIKGPVSAGGCCCCSSLGVWEYNWAGCVSKVSNTEEWGCPKVLTSIRTYRLFHVEDSSKYLVYGYADTDSSGHWPQSLWASELGNLWRDQRPGYERGKEYILGKATVK